MIYLKLEKESETLEELIKELFSCEELEIYIEAWALMSVKTYRNKECTQIDCSAGKYRSIDDLLEIMQTYFPEASEEECIEALINTRIEHNDKTFYPTFISCEDIGMPTFCYRRQYVCIDSFDSFYSTYSKFRNWAEVVSKIGITTAEELKERAGGIHNIYS